MTHNHNSIWSNPNSSTNGTVTDEITTAEATDTTDTDDESIDDYTGITTQQQLIEANLPIFVEKFDLNELQNKQKALYFLQLDEAYQLYNENPESRTQIIKLLSNINTLITELDIPSDRIFFQSTTSDSPTPTSQTILQWLDEKRIDENGEQLSFSKISDAYNEQIKATEEAHKEAYQNRWNFLEHCGQNDVEVMYIAGVDYGNMWHEASRLREGEVISDFLGGIHPNLQLIVENTKFKYVVLDSGVSLLNRHIEPFAQGVAFPASYELYEEKEEEDIASFQFKENQQQVAAFAANTNEVGSGHLDNQSDPRKLLDIARDNGIEISEEDIEMDEREERPSLCSL